MPSIEILTADCLEALQQVPDNSLDACLTDPPYGLSDHSEQDVRDCLKAWLNGEPYRHGSLRKGKKHCAANIARNAGILDPNHLDANRLAEFIKFPITLRGLRVCVTGAVDFNSGPPVGKVEIDGPKTDTVADDVLLTDLEARATKSLGNLCFDLRPLDTRAACVGQCTCFTLLNESVFSANVRLPFRAHDTKVPSDVVAFPRAEQRAVLRLDVRRNTAELCAADIASDGDCVFDLRCSHGIGALAGTGGLASMFDPSSFCFVLDTADLAGHGDKDLLATQGVGAGPTASHVFGLASVKLNPTNLAVFLHRDVLERLKNPILLQGGFMGNSSWDSWVPGPEIWREVFRVLKPGAYLACFASTRTADLMSIAIRLAGFRAQNTLMWITGQGFPKATSVSKALDRAAGVERPVVGPKVYADGTVAHNSDKHHDGYVRPFMGDDDWQGCKITAPATEAAKRWDEHFYGLQAIKPSHEPILLFQKPHEGRPVDSILKWGCGALNVGACRIKTGDNLNGGAYAETGIERDDGWGMQRAGAGEFRQPTGRWPATILLGHVADAPCPICNPNELESVECPVGCPACGGGGWIEGCRRVGTKRVKAEGGQPQTNVNNGMFGIAHGTAVVGKDGETVDNWECVTRSVWTCNAGSIRGVSLGTLLDCLLSIAEQIGKRDTTCRSLWRERAQRARSVYMGLSLVHALVVGVRVRDLAQTLAPGFQSDCPVCLHSCDEHVQRILASSLDGLPSLLCALAGVHSDLRKREYSQHYPHCGHLSSLDAARLDVLCLCLLSSEILSSGFQQSTNCRLWECVCQSECPCGMFPESQPSGSAKASKPTSRQGRTGYDGGWGKDCHRVYPGDSGSAARFFYCAKASRRERAFYCRDCQAAFWAKDREAHQHGHVDEAGDPTWGHLVQHPTVKPLALAIWLARLLTPKGGTVLDPFLGTGTTAVACRQEGFGCLGMEQDPEYAAIARMRAGSPPNDAKPTPAKRPGRTPPRPEPASGQKTLF